MRILFGALETCRGRDIGLRLERRGYLACLVGIYWCCADRTESGLRARRCIRDIGLTPRSLVQLVQGGNSSGRDAIITG